MYQVCCIENYPTSWNDTLRGLCRHDIEIIAREQEALATASSSVLAIKVHHCIRHCVDHLQFSVCGGRILAKELMSMAPSHWQIRSLYSVFPVQWLDEARSTTLLSELSFSPGSRSSQHRMVFASMVPKRWQIIVN